jgi:adenosylhomocysteinase
MSELERNLAWAQRHMTVTQAELTRLPVLDGVRLACSVHLTYHALIALETLLERGAALFVTTCNTATVQDECVQRLLAAGAQGHAWLNMTAADQADAIVRMLAWQPTHLFEMGADLSAAIVQHGRPTRVRAGLEVTGSGITRLERLADAGHPLAFPVFNCDDVPIKEGLHNRYLVGLMTWHTFTARTRLSLHGKRVLVIGYGLVGEGVATAARAWGGAVAVAERDPSRALQARFGGFETGTLEALLPAADVVVTATGAAHVLNARHFPLLKAGSFLLNVGHTSDEIEVEALTPRREVLPFVEEVEMAGRSIFLFAGGSMANLTAGQGDSLNSFDLTLGTMVAGLRYIFTPEAEAMAPGLHPLPRAAWESVAREASA